MLIFHHGLRFLQGRPDRLNFLSQCALVFDMILLEDVVCRLGDRGGLRLYLLSAGLYVLSMGVEWSP